MSQTDSNNEFSWPVPASHVGAIRHKVAEFNEKLGKRKNLDGKVTVTFSDGYVVNDPYDPEHGRRMVHANVSITGVFRIPGYRFAAIYEFLAGTDRPTVHRFKNTDGTYIDHEPATDRRECDHCGVRSLRKRVFVLDNYGEGSIKVGSSCLKDFTGYSPTQVLNVRRLVEEEFEDYFRGPIAAYVVDTREFVAAAEAVIRHRGGFVSVAEARDSQDLSTKDLALMLVGDRGRYIYETTGIILEIAKRHDIDKVQEAWTTIHKAEREGREAATAIIDWAANLVGGGDFQANMAAIAESSEIGRRQFGIAAYMPEGYRKAQMAARAEAKRNDRPTPSGPVAVGRHELEGEVVGLKWVENRYAYHGADVPKVTVLLEDGNLVHGTLPEAGIIPEVVGATVKFRATVTRSDRDRHFGFFKRPFGWETVELSEKGKALADKAEARRKRLAEKQAAEDAKHVDCEPDCYLVPQDRCADYKRKKAEVIAAAYIEAVEEGNQPTAAEVMDRLRAKARVGDRLTQAVLNRLEAQTDDTLAKTLGLE